MATVGHLAAGVALSRASGHRGSPVVALALVAASVAPDLDLLLGINHRGPTHSVGFAAMVGVAAFLAFRLLRDDAAVQIGLLAAAAVGIHILLDLLTAHSPVSIFWPLSRREFVLPVVLLPSAPTGEVLFTLRGLAALAAELAWAAALILVGGLRPQPRAAAPDR